MIERIKARYREARAREQYWRESAWGHDLNAQHRWMPRGLS